MIYLFQIIFLVLTYFVAAIPFGLVLTKFFTGKDIREFGSGNIGATNVTRVAGKTLGLVTFILDAFKGAIMVIIAGLLFSRSSYLSEFLCLVGAVAVLAHVFPIYLKFQGGKGVATTVAVLFAVNPTVGITFAILWLAVFFTTKTSSIASLFAILFTLILTTIGFLVIDKSLLDKVFLLTFLTILIFIRHKDNIRRIMDGTEIGFKKDDKSE